MYWVPYIGLALAMMLFAMVGYYLTLIAKFYRLKFSRGPRPRLMEISLVILLTGAALHLPGLTKIPSEIGQVLCCLGAIGFSTFVYLLYRSMMAPN
jgi:hypothetical protein